MSRFTPPRIVSQRTPNALATGSLHSVLPLLLLVWINPSIVTLLVLSVVPYLLSFWNRYCLKTLYTGLLAGGEGTGTWPDYLVKRDDQKK